MQTNLNGYMVCLLLFVVQRADIERDRTHVAKIYKEDSMFNPLLQCQRKRSRKRKFITKLP